MMREGTCTCTASRYSRRDSQPVNPSTAQEQTLPLLLVNLEIWGQNNWVKGVAPWSTGPGLTSQGLTEMVTILPC